MSTATSNGLHIALNVVVDIGTTNIVITDGTNTHRFRNPQYRYGSDVMSRMLRAIKGGQDEQTALLRKSLLENLSLFLADINSIDTKTIDNILPETPVDKKISSLVIVANTVQLHFLCGFDVRGMATYPFTPQSFFGRFFSLSEVFGEFLHEAGLLFADMQDQCDKTLQSDRFQKNVFIPPCFDAFIGADLIAASVGVGMWTAQNEQISTEQRTRLLIDIGTNTEILLMHEGKSLVASTSAGPAFEGGKIKSELKGSELLDALYVMRRQGQMDETGCIVVEKPLLRQKDIRILQLAKAAIRGAVDTLLFEMGIDDTAVDEVYITGVFGTHISPRAVVGSGLLSAELASKITLKGNAVPDGAFLFLCDNTLIDRVKNDFVNATLVQLADNEFFAQRYIEAMGF